MFNIFLILIAFIIQQSAPVFREWTLIGDGGRDLFVLCPLLTLAVMALFAASGLVVREVLRRRLAARPDRRDAYFASARRFALVYKAAVLCCYFVIAVVLNWHSLALKIANVFFVHILVELAPFFALLLISWFVYHRIERLFAFRKWTLWQYLVFQVRQNSLIVAALLVFSLFTDIASTYRGVEMFLTLYPEVMLLAFVPVVALVYTIIPFMARFLWKVERLPDGALRSRLEDVCRRSKIKVRDILLWHTGGGGVVNAAVLGIFPRARYVILTDGLVENLSHDEIEAVFGHELGHAHHGHIAYYASFLLAISFLTMYILEPFQSQDELVNVVMQFAVTFGLFIGVVFGLISRRFERQADLFGCKVSADPAAFVNALEKVSSASGGARALPSWSHSSVAKRIEFIAAAVRDPRVAESFQRRVRAICALIAFLGIGCLLYAGLRLVVVSRQERIASQIAQYEAFLSAASKEEERMEVYRDVAEIAMRERNYERAAIYYGRFFRNPQKAAQVLLNGRGDDAREGTAAGVREVALFFLENGFEPTAEVMFRCALVLAPAGRADEDFARLLWAQARLLERRNAADEALRRLEYAARFGPKIPEVRFESGMIRYLSALELRKDGARTAPEIQLKDVQPNPRDNWLILRMRIARDEFDAAFRLGGGQAALQMMARCSYFAGNYPGAIDGYSRFAGRLPFADVIRFGEACAYTGDSVGAAVNLCEIAPTLAATDWERSRLIEAKRRLAVAAMLLKPFSGAFSAYLECGRLETEAPFVFRYILAAEEMRGRGDSAGAEFEYDRALDVLPDNPVVTLRKADLLAQGGRFAEAVSLARGAANAPEGRGRFFGEAARVLRLCGEEELAEEYEAIAATR